MYSDEGIWLATISLILAFAGLELPILSPLALFLSFYILLKKGYSGGVKILALISLPLSILGTLLLGAIIRFLHSLTTV